jgi:hypothetical protein
MFDQVKDLFEAYPTLSLVVLGLIAGAGQTRAPARCA